MSNTRAPKTPSAKADAQITKALALLDTTLQNQIRPLAINHFRALSSLSDKIRKYKEAKEKDADGKYVNEINSCKFKFELNTNKQIENSREFKDLRSKADEALTVYKNTVRELIITNMTLEIQHLYTQATETLAKGLYETVWSITKFQGTDDATLVKILNLLLWRNNYCQLLFGLRHSLEDHAPPSPTLIAEAINKLLPTPENNGSTVLLAAPLPGTTLAPCNKLLDVELFYEEAHAATLTHLTGAARPSLLTTTEELLLATLTSPLKIWIVETRKQTAQQAIKKRNKENTLRAPTEQARQIVDNEVAADRPELNRLIEKSQSESKIVKALKFEVASMKNTLAQLQKNKSGERKPKRSQNKKESGNRNNTKTKQPKTKEAPKPTEKDRTAAPDAAKPKERGQKRKGNGKGTSKPKRKKK